MQSVHVIILFEVNNKNAITTLDREKMLSHHQ